MMQMLNAGGLPALTDNQRAPDAHNPFGYFEYEPVKSLARNASWMGSARGKAVKIVYSLLWYLPLEFEYRVVFMQRHLDDVFASQQEMLRTRGNDAVDQDRERIVAAFTGELKRTRDWLSAQPNIRTMIAEFSGILSSPAWWSLELSGFLDGLDTQAMAAAVDPQLRHYGKR